MKRKLAQDDSGDGLDSLLDTMTNVVGILVLVLIAVQLGVKDAVHRIADAEVVDAADLEAARDKLKLTAEQRDMIQASLQDLKPVDDKTIEFQLADLRRKAAESRSQLQQQEQAANRYSAKLDQDRKKAAAAKKQVEELADAEQKMKAIQQQITKSLEDEARLKAALDDTPAQQAPPAKVVTLPDPRPAPEGARQVTFLCVNNKVYPVAADDVRTAVRKQAELVVKARNLDRGPKVGVDPEQFLRDFNKVNRSLRDEFFEIELYASGIYPRLKFTPREKSGSTIAEVVNARSRFQKLLSLVDNEKYFARFIVLPDSYEAYLAARAVAAERGLLAGWDPQPASYVFSTYVGGSVLFGPKPPPADPNKPKPKPKPPNLID